MRTEIREVPRLEFVPVPESLTERCFAPLPPVDDDGRLYFEQLPGYAVEILGVLQECNIKMQQIEELGREDQEEEED